MMTPDQFHWAEALALEKLHGDAAPPFVGEGIGALTLAGDAVGVEQLSQIADGLDALICRASARA